MCYSLLSYNFVLYDAADENSFVFVNILFIKLSGEILCMR